MISTLEGVYVVLLWIIPGFFGYTVMRYVAIEVGKISDFDKLIWSLSFSCISYGIIFFLTGRPLTFEDLQQKIFEPIFLRNLWLLPSIIGFVVGLPSRLKYRRRISFGDCWMCFQTKLEDKKPGVTVYTKDGKEIEGILNYAGREKVDKELIITDPKMIIRDDNYEPIYEMELGKEMLFIKDDIARISFWENF